MTAKVGPVELWDGRTWLGHVEADGLLEFPFGWAPDGLLTRRQLREAGLAPGGQHPYGRLVWRHGERFAWLYREDLAAPKRVPTPAQLAAVEAALAARKVCVECGPVDHTVRKTDGLCGDCYAATLADNVDQADAVDQATDTDDVTEELIARYRPSPAAADPFQVRDERPFEQPPAVEERTAEDAVDRACNAIAELRDRQPVQDQLAEQADRETGEVERSDRARALAVWSGTEVTDALERARRSLDDLVSQQLQHNEEERWTRGDDLARWQAADETAAGGHDDNAWLERGVA